MDLFTINVWMTNFNVSSGAGKSTLMSALAYRNPGIHLNLFVSYWDLNVCLSSQHNRSG